MAHLLIAPDKFRSTATAREVADACARAVARTGHTCEVMPLADGGEGLLEVVGGETITTEVHGPLGIPVLAEWRLIRSPAGSASSTAVIEMARASGLSLVGGAEHNDPILASTRGTGELISAALDAGATRLIVGLGGSATTDGGVGAVEVLEGDLRLDSVDLLVACDVTTTFIDAARVFGPQKGADEHAIRLLTSRLAAQAEEYLERLGVDVTAIPGSGAAGGLGGGLAALGGRLESGFALVADLLGLDAAIERSDLVVTGEGALDRTSFNGKVVGAVVERVAGRAEICCVVGRATDEAIALAAPMTVISLTARYGLERATTETTALVEQSVAEFLEGWRGRA